MLVHSVVYTKAPFILKFLSTKKLYYCQELLRIVYEKELEFREKVGVHKALYERITRKIRKMIDLENANNADEIITNSYFSREKINSVYKKKAFVCYPGVDCEVFYHSEKVENQVLIMGSKEDIDGYNLAKGALQTINKEKRPTLVKLGFGDKDSRVKSDTIVREIYSQSIATLCLDINEPFGLKAIESMACETPVIAVDQGGYKETVVNGKTGFLVQRDPRIIAEKIRYFMDNPDIRNRMGKEGRKHVIQNFSWEKHNHCLLKAIESVVKK